MTSDINTLAKERYKSLVNSELFSKYDLNPECLDALLTHQHYVESDEYKNSLQKLRDKFIKSMVDLSLKGKRGRPKKGQSEKLLNEFQDKEPDIIKLIKKQLKGRIPPNKIIAKKTFTGTKSSKKKPWKDLNAEEKLEMLPTEIEDRALKPGITEFSGVWYPVLELSPKDELVNGQPFSIWFKHYNRTNANIKKMLSLRLIYYYGSESLSQAFAIVNNEKKFISGDSYEELLKKSQELSKKKADTWAIRGFKEMKEDLKRDRDDRLHNVREEMWNSLDTKEEGLVELEDEENIKDDVIDNSEEDYNEDNSMELSDDEENGLNLKVSTTKVLNEKNFKKRKAIDIGDIPRKARLKRRRSARLSLGNADVDSDSGDDTLASDKRQSRKLKMTVVYEGSDPIKNVDIDYENELSSEESSSIKGDKHEEKQKRSKTRKSAGSLGTNITKPSEMSMKDCMERFSGNEQKILPILFELHSSVLEATACDPDSVKKHLEDLHENIVHVIAPFIESYQVGKIIGLARKMFKKTRPDILKSCKEINSILKSAYELTSKLTPKNFSPELSDVPRFKTLRMKQDQDDDGKSIKQPVLKCNTESEVSIKEAQEKQTETDEATYVKEKDKKDEGPEEEATKSSMKAPSLREAKSPSTKVPTTKKRKSFLSMKELMGASNASRPVEDTSIIPTKMAQPGKSKEVPRPPPPPPLPAPLPSNDWWQVFSPGEYTDHIYQFDPIFGDPDEITRKLALEGLTEAVEVVFPNDFAHTEKLGKLLERTIFEWARLLSNVEERSQAYWEKAADVTTGIIGNTKKGQPGVMVSQLRDGKFPTVQSLIESSWKDFYNSFSGTRYSW